MGQADPDQGVGGLLQLRRQTLKESTKLINTAR